MRVTICFNRRFFKKNRKRCRQGCHKHHRPHHTVAEASFDLAYFHLFVITKMVELRRPLCLRVLPESFFLGRLIGLLHLLTQAAAPRLR